MHIFTSSFSHDFWGLKSDYQVVGASAFTLWASYLPPNSEKNFMWYLCVCVCVLAREVSCYGCDAKKEHGIGKGPPSSPGKLTLGKLTAWVAMRITRVNMLRRPGNPLLTRDNTLFWLHEIWTPKHVGKHEMTKYTFAKCSWKLIHNLSCFKENKPHKPIYIWLLKIKNTTTAVGEKTQLIKVLVHPHCFSLPPEK